MGIPGTSGNCAAGQDGDALITGSAADLISAEDFAGAASALGGSAALPDGDANEGIVTVSTGWDAAAAVADAGAAGGASGPVGFPGQKPAACLVCLAWTGCARGEPAKAPCKGPALSAAQSNSLQTSSNCRIKRTCNDVRPGTNLHLTLLSSPCVSMGCT